jgi:iron complex outermembrane receptor protein
VKSIHATTDLLCKSLLVLSIAASAQAMEDSASRLIEEVVVTAEHRESTLQETRISISAFDTETIRELGISNALDLGHFVPNVNVQPYVGGKTGVSYNIRGVGNAETLISFDPAVSVYLDGVLISKNVGALLDVVDLQRVEVLRGPQGTLYGQNTMGGAINYITQNPASEFEARLEATAGNYDQRDLRGMVNVPLLGADSGAGELNVRVTAATLNRDGIQDNDFDGGAEDEMGTVDRNVYMGQLEWVPTERFSARYTYDRTRIDEIPEAAYITNANLATFYGTSAPTALPSTTFRSRRRRWTVTP